MRLAGLPFAELIGGPEWKFQLVNVAFHPENPKNWFNSHNLKVLDWPACIPNLNPIENLWGIMSLIVY